jgi:hypothetical protein
MTQAMDGFDKVDGLNGMEEKRCASAWCYGPRKLPDIGRCSHSSPPLREPRVTATTLAHLGKGLNDDVLADSFRFAKRRRR